MSGGDVYLDPAVGTGLVFVSTPTSTGNRVVSFPDRQAVADRRDRAICKALLRHALDLIEEAEDNGE